MKYTAKKVTTTAACKLSRDLCKIHRTKKQRGHQLRIWRSNGTLLGFSKSARPVNHFDVRSQVARLNKLRDPARVYETCNSEPKLVDERTTECNDTQMSSAKNLHENKVENLEQLLESGAFGQVTNKIYVKYDEIVDSEDEKMSECSDDQSSLYIDLDDKTVRFENLEWLKLLGSGSYGEVYLCRDQNTSRHYAVKKLVKERVEERHAPMRENRILKSVTHPFLVSMKRSFQDCSHFYFVMEFANGGDLFGHKMRRPNYIFSEDCTRFVAAELTLALSYLHDSGIIYRDLKLDNILMDREGHIKIADFGLSKDGMTRESRTTTMCGTDVYMAPEVICEETGSYGFSADWWSLGVVIYEMLTGQYPFSGEESEDIYQLILDEDLEFPFTLSFEAESLISGLLVKDPSKRLDKWDVASHEFFCCIDWEKLESKQLQPPYVPVDLRYFDLKCTERESVELCSTDKGKDKIEFDYFEGFDFIDENYYHRQSQAKVVSEMDKPSSVYFRPDIS